MGSCTTKYLLHTRGVSVGQKASCLNDAFWSTATCKGSSFFFIHFSLLSWSLGGPKSIMSYMMLSGLPRLVGALLHPLLHSFLHPLLWPFLHPLLLPLCTRTISITCTIIRNITVSLSVLFVFPALLRISWSYCPGANPSLSPALVFVMILWAKDVSP